MAVEPTGYLLRRNRQSGGLPRRSVNTQDVGPLSALSAEHLSRYYRIITGAIGVHAFPELLSWLQGELQYYLPHERLIVASGDFASHRIDLEVIPALPGAPARAADPRPLSTFLQTLLHHWIEGKRLPLTLDILESGGVDFRSPADAPDSAARILHGGRWLLIHGITDRRSNRDGLYVMLGSKRYSRSALNAMQVLLPYLDTTLRRVASPVPSHVYDSTSGEWGLSRREQEIMKWVRLGKTNFEIASILGISAFTVKNHMRRIFKTLGVASRVQAAMKMAPPEERGE